ncbi:MAG: SGNH/GDSL hydrolase family protein [Salinivirgaceae bacterium]|nr:SGNH/GDSL hydrolase family protein [Salinivirgaceae bacterium]
MNSSSRRKFLKLLGLTGIAALFFRGIKSFAMEKPIYPDMETNKGMTILFQGDSITDGNRGRDADPNHIMGHGYAFSIASRLGADHPEKDYNFINRGISANKIIDLKERWKKDTLDLNPDILSILIGVNDSSSMVVNWDPKVTVDIYEEVYRALLEQTRAKFPNIIFVLCEPFILKVGQVKEHWNAYQADVALRQAVVQKLATEFDAVFVGFQDVMTKACEKAPAEYWMWDGVHPTVAGHELLAREWITQVEERIKF